MGSGWRGGGQGGGARGTSLASAEPRRTCGCRHPAGRAVAAASALAGAAHTFMRPLLPAIDSCVRADGSSAHQLSASSCFFFFFSLSFLPLPPPLSLSNLLCCTRRKSLAGCLCWLSCFLLCKIAQTLPAERAPPRPCARCARWHGAAAVAVAVTVLVMVVRFQRLDRRIERERASERARARASELRKANLTARSRARERLEAG